jgi:mono/diheme cytochrome c family protein
LSLSAIGPRSAALIGIAATLSGCGGGAPAAPANASPGQRAFAQADCGSCHTLAAAGSSGTAGPNLNGRSLTSAVVQRWIRTGGGGMPTFGQLSDAEVQQLADFVASSSSAKP